MKKYSYHHIAELLFGHRTSLISGAGRRELDQWLKEEKKNVDLFEHLMDDKGLKDTYELYKSIDHKAPLQQARERTGTSRVIVSVEKLLKYAAILVLVLSLAPLTYWFFGGFQKQEYTQLSYNDISQPGSTKAYVKLENGQIVELSDGDDQLIEGSDYKLEKDSLNKLSYNTEAAGRNKTALSEKIHSIVTPRGGEYQLVLSDGSKVWLNSVSELSYPLEFGDEKREVSLKGEAYFEVTEDASRPFIVKTPSSSIEVLGTMFNYRSYSTVESDEVTLVEGSVKVMGEESELIIEPGYQAIVTNGQGGIIANKVNARLYTSWTEGKMEFHRMCLDRITDNLCRWYDVEFRFTEEEIMRTEFSGGLYKDESIEFILTLIEETTDVSFEIENGSILVGRKDFAGPIN